MEDKKLEKLFKKSNSLFVNEIEQSEGSGCDSEMDSSPANLLKKYRKQQSGAQKSKFLKKFKTAVRKRKFSAGYIENLEDINDYLNKSLSPIKRDKQSSELESAKKVHVGGNDAKKRKTRVAPHYIALSMKGYYSDSVLDEIRKVEMEK